MITAGYSISLCCVLGLLVAKAARAVVTIKSQYSPDIRNIDGQPFFLPGELLELGCTSDDERSTVAWKRLGTNQTWNLIMNGTSGSRLTLTPIKSSAGGNYSCDDGQKPGKYFFVNVLSVDSVVPISQITNGTALHTVLECKQNFTHIFPLIWTRRVGGAEVVLNENPKTDRNFTVNNLDREYSLELRSNGRYPLKTGDYQCQLNTSKYFQTPRPLAHRVSYEARPDIRIYEPTLEDSKSKVSTANEPLTIVCLHSGSNSTRVRWVYENQTLQDGTWLPEQRVIVDFDDRLIECPHDRDRYCSPKNPRYAFYRDDKLENQTDMAKNHERSSVLYLQNAESYDRGTYWCFAQNYYGINSASIFVRVKDPYAALYPFLGVVAEIVLLFLIIGCCERKRRKQKMREEEAQLLNESVPYDAAATAQAGVNNRKL